MFYYFPDNYTWSSAVMLSIMAGGSRANEHPEDDLRQGFRRSASAGYLRASTAYEIGAAVASPINQTRKQ
ncbi:MAG: hypothetical protein JWR34_7177 [Mycobacterium sp.]|nr:hypothetical protein [Mycobacterium sp.]